MHDEQLGLLASLVTLPATGAVGTTWIYALDRGTVSRVTDCAYPTWMRDGRRVICNRAGRLVVVEVSSGRLRDLPITLSALSPARLAADDSQLFFLSGTISADVWVALSKGKFFAQASK